MGHSIGIEWDEHQPYWIGLSASKFFKETSKWCFVMGKNLMINKWLWAYHIFRQTQMVPEN